MHKKVFQVAKRKYPFGELGLKLKCNLRVLKCVIPVELSYLYDVYNYVYIQICLQ